ncbi:uncharacterized protein SEPMUDRAFT_106257 [Sphaerulina musiva SO2202]|uniref:Uncharacterized protein n=1 Tax=Sphaerulina musiva (strain SO2202) TaxID=692275 RepID=M3CQZ5_SPHMS|nr:uncharacterized protein SEPMUDRAFT_106257 [Sphaerulina musiva SO2202]EMF16093.1 hypothetical protein SEPMUDRAFT_106257 [Sphaerulina musiva SO2202]
MTTIHINIVVYEGFPLKYPEYRHTVLWLQSASQSPSLIAHIVGNPQKFKFQCRPTSKEPQDSLLYRKLIELGPPEVAATSEEIVAILQHVPIDNSDPKFNCQIWVELALGELKNEGILSEESHRQGLDRMWSAIADAKDVK